MKGIVLVIGPNLGFVFWLGRALDHAGYEAFPARTVDAAAETISDFHLIPELVILTASMPRSNELIADLKRLREDVRVLRLAEPGDGNNLPSSPTQMTEEGKAVLLKAVSAVLVDNRVVANNSR